MIFLAVAGSIELVLMLLAGILSVVAICVHEPGQRGRKRSIAALTASVIILAGGLLIGAALIVRSLAEPPAAAPVAASEAAADTTAARRARGTAHRDHAGFHDTAVGIRVPRGHANWTRLSFVEARDELATGGADSDTGIAFRYEVLPKPDGLIPWPVLIDATLDAWDLDRPEADVEARFGSDPDTALQDRTLAWLHVRNPNSSTPSDDVLYVFRVQQLADHFITLIVYQSLPAARGESERARALNHLETLVRSVDTDARTPGQPIDLPHHQAAWSADYLSEIAHLLRQRDYTEEAGAMFRAAHQAHPDDAGHLIGHARAVFDAGEPDEAQALLNEAAGHIDGSAEARLLRAEILESTGEPGQARDLLLLLTKGGRITAEGLTRLLRLSRETEAGEVGLDAWAEAPPDLRQDVNVAVESMRLHESLGRAEAADIIFAQLLADPRTPAWVRLERLRTLVDHRRGGVELAMQMAGRWLSDDSFAGTVERANTRFGLAVAADEADRHADALAHFRAAETLMPGWEIDDWIRSSANALGFDPVRTASTPIDPLPLPDLLQRRQARRAKGGGAADRVGAEAAAAAGRSRYIDYELTVARVAIGRPSVVTHRYRERVLDANARREATEIRVDYDPRYEDLDIHHLAVFDPDGRQVSVADPESFFAIDQTGISYDRGKTLVLPVPALEVGGAFELTYSRRSRYDLDRIPHRRYRFGGPDPRGLEAYAVVGESSDLDRVIDRTQNTDRRLDRLDRLASATARVWVREDSPGKRWDGFSPPIGELFPHLFFGDNRTTWASVIEAEFEHVADVLADAGPAFDAFVKPLVSEHGDLTEVEDPDRLAAAIRAAYDRVVGHVVYQSIAFGSRGYTPYPVDQTVRQRYGDCKDYSVLLTQTLRRLGIDAELVVASSSAPIHPEVAGNALFDHMLVWLPPIARVDPAASPVAARLAAGTLLDGTDTLQVPLGGRPPYLDSEHVLPLREDATQATDDPLVRVEKAMPPREVTVRQRVDLAADGRAAVRETWRFAGMAGTDLRTLLADAENGQHREIIGSRCRLPAGASVENIFVSDLTRQSEPVRVDLHYDLPAGSDTVPLEIPLPLLETSLPRFDNPYRSQDPIWLDADRRLRVETTVRAAPQQDAHLADLSTLATRGTGLRFQRESGTTDDGLLRVTTTVAVAGGTRRGQSADDLQRDLRVAGETAPVSVWVTADRVP